MLRNSGSYVSGNLQMDQQRLTAHVQQILNEWQIQFLVLMSFGLQAFLLLFSGIRKRTISSVVRVLLWLAYVSADSLATFVLGHLTLHINGLRHELVLFWAPFMLLHLGGQETITAFSMEDNMLWKRHLLSLVQQVAMVVYVVGKQWQGGSLLMAPLVLMFTSGTIRYAERTWALMTAAKSATPGSCFDLSDVHKISTYAYLFQIRKSLQEDEPTYAKLVWLASVGLDRWMAFLKDVMPSLQRGTKKIKFSEEFLRNKNRVHRAFKLVEVQLSLIYDYCYTKLGARHCHLSPIVSAIPRLLTLGSTCAALTLFVWADTRGSLVNYRRADVAVSYTLLIGAIVLEILSNFMVISSYWAYLTAVKDFPRGRSAIFSIVKLAHPESRCQWSDKLTQYNIVGRCIMEKQAGLLGWIIQWIGISSDTTSVDASSDLKELLLDKLLNVANSPHVDEWDFTKFHGQWAKWVLQSKFQGSTAQDLFVKTIDRVDFLSNIIIWHIATDICLSDDEVCNSPCRGPSRKLSSYVMYLASKHGILVGNDGHFVLEMARREIVKFVEEEVGGDKKALKHCKVVKSMRDKVGREYDLAEEHIKEFPHLEVFSDVPILPRVNQLATGLLKLKEIIDPWELIINVWMEMLCYMSPHCGSGFHFNHVGTGGEFVTHVRILLLNLGLTVFLPENSTTR
ncbi:uncharacterized protein LOC133886497 [Phragmites australis]|uniref:uncharacterized protein LOC133886497 n=1 Tax=Phragmites australis TaxID=29695 RepID=UPI002D79AD7B|nr:uncharacterized protein LOC133886497 [Phragmites australis]